VYAACRTPHVFGPGWYDRRRGQSHLVSIQDAPHDSMNARPEAFNTGLNEYLDHLEQGKPVAGRRVL